MYTDTHACTGPGLYYKIPARARNTLEHTAHHVYCSELGVGQQQVLSTFQSMLTPLIAPNWLTGEAASAELIPEHAARPPNALSWIGGSACGSP